MVRDPLLAEVWADTVAIYEGDSHLPRVFHALEIPVLDEQVEVTPKPADRLEDVEQDVSTRLDEVGPALLATAAADYGSRREEIARSLRALQLVCTSELGLKYALKGHAPRQTVGATAFIQEGTAYLAVDEGEPDWSAFGLRLAETTSMFRWATHSPSCLMPPLEAARTTSTPATSPTRTSKERRRFWALIAESVEMPGHSGWEYADRT